MRQPKMQNNHGGSGGDDDDDDHVDYDDHHHYGRSALAVYHAAHDGLATAQTSTGKGVNRWRGWGELEDGHQRM